MRNAQSRRDGRTYQTWGDLHRNVSPLLGLGILIAPLIFGWTLLDKRYSTRARVLGLGWTGFLVIVVALSVANAPRVPQAASPAQVATQQGSPPAVTPPTTDNVEWSHYDGDHYVKCMIENGVRWYIYMPDQDDLDAGVGPRVNQTPTDELWAEFCPRG